MTVALWTVAILLIVIGIAGTVLPALPGLLFVFGGIVLAGYADGFSHVSGWTIGIAAVLTLIGFGIEYAATALSAQRAGASRLGLIGALAGGVAGIFTGPIGVLFLPLVGAFAGELIARGDALRAGHVGIATWIGMVVGSVAKIGIALAMVGVLAIAMIF
jgi:uncharacterized protein YqgC (DUF456 family)